MLLEFPDDPACDYLDRQYMLGESLLVAPVFAADGLVDYYLPAGRWTHFLTGQVVEGGRWLRETHDFMSLPLMVRPNSIIAIGSQDDRPDYDHGEGVTLHLYELADGIAARAVIDDLTFTARRDGQTITIQREGPAKAWQVLLMNIEAVGPVTGGIAESRPQGMRVNPAAQVGQLVIQTL
jgi:alpha-D-xyloside xylohydrolase